MKQLVMLLGVASALVRAQAGGVYVSASVPLYSYSYLEIPDAPRVPDAPTF